MSELGLMLEYRPGRLVVYACTQ